MTRHLSSTSAYTVAALTIASLAVGIAIASQLSVGSGIDVAHADPSKLLSMRPLLLAAEGLKVLVGLGLLVAAYGSSRLISHFTSAFLVGVGASVLLIAAGALGLCVILGLGSFVTGPLPGRIVAWLGLLSLPLTGVWAALTLRSSEAAPKWLRLLAISLAIIGSASALLPALGMLFGVLSILFWLGLASVLRRLEATTFVHSWLFTRASKI